ncbi:hypothetical protein M3P21_01290 [Ruegeria sp. 2012CJ41-6]|uniref:Uncharacterized protein n=1 Tax=Ruegeria spongiae TaxID=2942209 RepID=A0ABT0PX37_9RHOB|nr:hypothetical protein [Ruegeria spongiae]MCL6282150.1 hypothetical protein [Ruegeria spongiae]
MSDSASGLIYVWDAEFLFWIKPGGSEDLDGFLIGGWTNPTRLEKPNDVISFIGTTIANERDGNPT